MVLPSSTKPSIIIRDLLSQNRPLKTDHIQPCIGFSHLRHIKLLETRIVSLLHHFHDLNRIKHVHGHIIRRGLTESSFVLTKLVRSLTKIGTPMDSYIRLIFEQVKQPNPFLWTVVIRGYFRQGLFRESIVTYVDMRRNDSCPVSFTFSSMFKVCAAVLDSHLGQQVHVHTITLGGFDSDLYVGNSMIDMYVKCGFLDYARKVFDDMSERDVISWTSLIVAYTKNADMESAVGMFENLPMKNKVAWTSIITGFAQNSMPNEALDFFRKMLETGVETDEFTLVGVISACSQLGAFKYANWVREITEKSGFGPPYNVVIGSSLIDMFLKCGSIEDAHQVFVKMKSKNVYSYSSMILGFAIHGCANSAFQLFNEMLKTGTRPNGVTFIGLLTACSHSGMVDKGRTLFQSMEERFNVKPSSYHYVCMVDILGRGGFLEEALRIIETMPIEPTSDIWGAILGACYTHKNLKIAEIVAGHLSEIDPSCIGSYSVLLSNIYASAGMWGEFSKMRVLMKRKLGLKKKAGYSLLEGRNGAIYEFVSGDMIYGKDCENNVMELKNVLNRLALHCFEPTIPV